ncbi:MAG: hypothetical protein ACFFCS_16695 [Candidatus Hodarchaeota archaeon]
MPLMDIIAFIAKCALIFIYLYVFLFFLRNYVKSKKTGFKNNFFLGYAIFFGALFFFQIGLVVADIIDFVIPGFLSASKGEFPNKIEGGVVLFENLVKPLYLLGLIMMMVLLVGQIRPVEEIINWKKRPITAFLIIVIVLLLLVFIPMLTWTIFSDIAFGLCIAGLILGLLLNVGVNIRLAAVSTGDLKRRSLMIIFGTIFFYLGFLWTLEIGEISLGQFIPDWGPNYDLILGCVVQGIAVLLFRLGLKPSAT